MTTKCEEVKGGPSAEAKTNGKSVAPDKHPKFELGTLVITGRAKDSLKPADVFSALGRHLIGDWGNVSQKEWQMNDLSIAGAGTGQLICSAYSNRSHQWFFIITELDRSMTTILLPDEY